MNRLQSILALSAFILISCSAPPADVRDVSSAYERFAQALRTEDAAALEELAPFLAKPEAAEALEILKGAIAGKPAYRVRLLDEAGAVVQLSDARRTAIPFSKGASGTWIVSESLRRIQFVDIVPAEAPEKP